VYIATASVVVALSVRLDDTAVTLLGGTLAVAIGFAMRDLVASVIAGVIIMLDRPFQVGARVEYAGTYGDIVAIGLRSVRMYTLDENTVTIPNNKMLTEITSSADSYVRARQFCWKGPQRLRRPNGD
jgi:small-conductance mechanosensitive channel